MVARASAESRQLEAATRAHRVKMARVMARLHGDDGDGIPSGDGSEGNEGGVASGGGGDGGEGSEEPSVGNDGSRLGRPRDSQDVGRDNDDKRAISGRTSGHSGTGDTHHNGSGPRHDVSERGTQRERLAQTFRVVSKAQVSAPTSVRAADRTLTVQSHSGRQPQAKQSTSDDGHQHQEVREKRQNTR